jgi:diacylglycerol kinase
MKNRKLIDSIKNSINGIIYTIKTERNMKIHVLAAILVIILSFLYRLSNVELCIICITVGLVLVCELFNTAIETLVDIIVDVYHPKAKIIKDAAAGAVFISALISLAICYFIFFDKVRTDIQNLFQHLKNIIHF